MLEHDADVRDDDGAVFRNLKTVADKASKSLHALEHLTIAPRRRRSMGGTSTGNHEAFRLPGKVVIVAFWETGGAVMAMVPQNWR